MHMGLEVGYVYVGTCVFISVCVFVCGGYINVYTKTYDDATVYEFGKSCITVPSRFLPMHSGGPFTALAKYSWWTRVPIWYIDDFVTSHSLSCELIDYTFGSGKPG